MSFFGATSCNIYIFNVCVLESFNFPVRVCFNFKLHYFMFSFNLLRADATFVPLPSRRCLISAAFVWTPPPPRAGVCNTLSFVFFKKFGRYARFERTNSWERETPALSVRTCRGKNAPSSDTTRSPSDPRLPLLLTKLMLCFLPNRIHFNVQNDSF